MTLTAHTIKALRLLALLKDESQNDVAEAMLIAGGLHSAVDSEWSAGQTKPTATAPAPVQVPLTPKPVTTAAPQAPAPASIPMMATVPPKPEPTRAGWMPDVSKPPADGDELPW